MLEKVTSVDTWKDVSADIVLLSDIHADKNTDYTWLYKAAKELDGRDTSAIMVLGDTLNDGCDTESAKQMCEVYYEFAKRAPVIIITGNHDLVTKKGERWRFIRLPEDVATLENNFNNFAQIPGVKVLRNESTTLKNYNIRINGIEMDPSYYRNERSGESHTMLSENLATYFDNPTNKDEYNIFLSHSPINLMEPDFRGRFQVFDETDLHLSGHMHNGLLPIYLEKLVPNNYGLVGKKIKTEAEIQKEKVKLEEMSKFLKQVLKKTGEDLKVKPFKIDLFPELSKGLINFGEEQYGIIANPYCTFSSDKGNKTKLNKYFPPVLQTVKIRKRTR